MILGICGRFCVLDMWGPISAALFSLQPVYLLSLLSRLLPLQSLTPHIWHSILRVNITVAWLWWLDEAVFNATFLVFLMLHYITHMIGSCMGCLSNVFLCQSLYNMITFFLFSRRENTIISTTK